MDKDFIDRLNKYSQNWQRCVCWVYLRNGTPEIYNEYKPNTYQIWIQFYKMNHYFWNMIERQCLEKTTGYNERDVIVSYNQCKLKKFFLKYLIKDWSLPFEIKRNIDGSLLPQLLQKIYNLHPFILKTLIQQYDYFVCFSQEEQKQINKQCYLLFDKDGSVTNPHWSVSLYLELSFFWQKFGLNYYDIQNLPIQVFESLKKITRLENASFNSKMNAKSNASSNSKQIRF